MRCLPCSSPPLDCDMSAPRDDNIIKVRGLVNVFGDNVVHDGLDLDVKRGEVIGIVGGSGTGKSVLLRSILGLKTPDDGIIEVFGKNISLLSDDDRSLEERRWGVLFQDGDRKRVG